MKKRIISLLTAASLTVVSAFAVNIHAQPQDNTDYDYDFRYGMLTAQALGVDSALIEPDSNVTRASAAEYISAILFGKDNYPVASGMFSDVDKSYSQAAAIEYMASQGIINGYGDGTYRPETEITGAEAVKMLVTALGYGLVAGEKGGYPYGYFVVANEQGITKGVTKLDGAITFADFIKLWINFSERKPLTVNISNTGNSYSSGDATILDDALSREELYYSEGILTGNSYGSMIDNTLDYLEIDNISYRYSGAPCDELIGFSVCAYIRDRGASDEVVAIMSGADNVTVEIDSADLDRLSLTSVSYYTEKRHETENFASVPFFVKNGRVLASPTNSGIAPVNGRVILISNDGDKDYEYVQVESKEYFKVDRVSADNHVVFLKDGQYQGKSAIELDETNDEYKHFIYNSDGTPADFGIIKPQSYVSISGSSDSRIMKVRVADERVEGRISAISDDEWITVGDSDYVIADTADGGKVFDIAELNLSDNYIFYCDGKKIIGYEETEESKVYGYVIATLEKGGLDSEIMYQIVSDDKEIYEGALADKVRYNGSSTDKKYIPDLSGKLITYKTNSDSRINEINVSEAYGEAESRRYVASSSAFVSISYKTPLFVSDSTKIFVVPDSGVLEDYKSHIRFLNDENYEVQGFGFDDETKVIDALVVYSDSYYDTAGILNSDSPVVLFDEARRTLDENGDTVYKLTWIEGDETVSSIAKSTSGLDKIISEMKRGDVFRYSKNSIDQVDNIEILLEPEDNDFHTGAGTIKELAYGTVIDAYSNVIPKGNIGKITNALDIDIGGETKSFLLNSDEEINYYLYDIEAKEAKPASFEDILHGNIWGNVAASKVFIYTVLNETRTVVIIK